MGVRVPFRWWSGACPSRSGVSGVKVHADCWGQKPEPEPEPPLGPSLFPFLLRNPHGRGHRGDRDPHRPAGPPACRLGPPAALSGPCPRSCRVIVVFHIHIAFTRNLDKRQRGSWGPGTAGTAGNRRHTGSQAPAGHARRHQDHQTPAACHHTPDAGPALPGTFFLSSYSGLAAQGSFDLMMSSCTL